VRVGAPPAIGALTGPERHEDAPAVRAQPRDHDPQRVRVAARVEVDADLGQRVIPRADEVEDAAPVERAVGKAASEEVAAARRRTSPPAERTQEPLGRRVVAGEAAGPVEHEHPERRVRKHCIGVQRAIRQPDCFAVRVQETPSPLRLPCLLPWHRRP
jgi:hypothetical protein